MSKFKIISIFYIFTILSLFLYSFTQVDLGLTLTKLSIWQVLQRFFQNIGYFQRPLSAVLYLAIIIALFIFYLIFLKMAHKNGLTRKNIWFLILVTGVVLLFSYNAFSYDLFNYIFDAKIVTNYGQNPYEHKALDYPFDPMLSFMHWTHRTLPYGQVWLFLTVSLSFLGMQIFLPTYFLFKALMAASYLFSAFLIGRILRKISPKDELFGVVFFAFNPLVLIEGLVSAHNDIVMISLSLLAFYFIINTNYIRSLIMFAASIGIKFATAALTPLFFYAYLRKKQGKELDWQRISLFSVLLMIIPVILASFRTNFQPWYLLSILPFASFISKRYYILIPTLIVSFFSLLQYIPFLYTGNWDSPIPVILFWLVFSSITISFVITGLSFLRFKMVK